MKRPPETLGLRHVALFVKNFAACEQFYCEILGFQVDWQPDADNIYLSTGADNLALHRAKTDLAPQAEQGLDHIGLMLKTAEDVDTWHAFVKSQGITDLSPPKTHRDGARSFYCNDPDGNTVQLIHHPKITA